jgi:(p)ppGpp synthase/HD superfamily hydrolase
LEQGDRADLMAASVARAARVAGLDDAGFELLARAHALAMSPRIAALEDDHHPAYLHPGRAVLLLLRDVGPLPASTLAAAAVHETVDDDLRVSEEAVRDELGDEVADLVASLPAPGEDGLAERLVTLDEQARLAALAERLDQLRHAHLRPDLEWRAAWEEAEAVWLPVAERTHPRLADRFRNWHRAYGRRLR